MVYNSFYRGWNVLSGSFICAALSIGFTSYIFGMFTVPVTAELGISRATYNNGMIGLLIGGIIASPAVGKLLDYYSARWVVAMCGIAFGLSLMIVSRIDNLWVMVLLVTFPLSFATAGCGILGGNTIAVRWFKRRRGRALGILAVSTSVGGFFSQPLTAFMIESLGWRDALFFIGLVPMIIFVLTATLIIRDRPSAGVPGRDDEFEGRTDDYDVGQDRLWTTKELLVNRNFWLVSLAIGLMLGVDQAVLASQVPYFQDIGYDLKTISLLVAVKTISAIGGKLAVGYLADKIDARYLFGYVVCANVTLLTIYIIQPSFIVLLLAVALLGIAIGGVFPAWSIIMARLFGTRGYGSVMGLMGVITSPLAVVLMRFIGVTHDRTGSYVLAFVVFIGLGLTAAVLIAMTRTQTRPPELHSAAQPAIDARQVPN